MDDSSISTRLRSSGRVGLDFLFGVLVVALEGDGDLQVAVVAFLGLQVDGERFHGHEDRLLRLGRAGRAGGVAAAAQEEPCGGAAHADQHEHDQDDQQQLGGAALRGGGSGIGGSSFGHGDYSTNGGDWPSRPERAGQGRVLGWHSSAAASTSFQ
ncbi:hypothetical protein LGV80_26230 (plasmid) [Ralstonia pseudosolanacearum]|nr:hypothetical protein LGV80_26230 [Ralstonia sp. RS642]